MEKKNTVKLEDLEAMINGAETQEAIFWGKELVVSYKLKNGFTISGRAACVSPENFNLEIGHKIAKENAINELWQLEGYVLQNRLFESGELK